MTPKRLNRLFNVAITESNKSTYRYKIGAVIFKRNKVIARGFNTIKTHPKMIEHNEWGVVHAEMSAVMSAKVDVRGMSMFVGRLNKNGEIALSKPCIDCQRILKQVGINEVYYTTGKFPFFDKMRLID